MARRKRATRKSSTIERARKAKSEKRRRRRINLFKKGAALKTLCGSQVYMLVKDDDGHIYSFNSEPNLGWVKAMVRQLLPSLLRPKADRCILSCTRQEYDTSVCKSVHGSEVVDLSMKGRKIMTRKVFKRALRKVLYRLASPMCRLALNVFW
jgi:SRF-type transcription factor (DNA-binding and dimerisation domain)